MSETKLIVYTCDSCGTEDVQKAEEGRMGDYLLNEPGVDWVRIAGKAKNGKMHDFLACPSCMARAWSLMREKS